MAVKREHQTRVFRYAGQDIADPNPAMSTEAVLKSLSDQYPELQDAKVEPPEVDAETGVHTFNIRAVAGTKG